MLVLRLDTLCTYTSAMPASRNMIEGQNVINSGMIIMCGATMKAQDKIELYSLCLKTSALSPEPHVIAGTLLIHNTQEVSDSESIVSIKSMDCSCKAGASHSCKHIVAVLLYCNRKDLRELQLVSSTDKKCIWNQNKGPVLDQFEAVPIKNFCCVKPNRLPALSVATLMELRNELIDCDSGTAIAKHSNRRSTQRLPLQPLQTQNVIVNSVHVSNTNTIIANTLKSEAILLLNTVTVTLNDCCKDTFSKTLAHHTDIFEIEKRTRGSKSEWLKERKFRITGSRCYSIFTYSKDAWPEKARKYFWNKQFKSKYTAYGNKYESEARESFRKQSGLHVHECGLIVSESEPWLAYSPDGIIIENSKLSALLEIKCPYELKDTEEGTLIQKCKYFILDKGLKLKKRHQYYAQVQLGMALLNLKYCQFVIYSNLSQTLRVLSISFDNVYAHNLLITLKQKYFHKMLHQICINSRT